MTKLVVKKQSAIWTVIRFLCIVSYRFFLGKPMHGKKLDNSSFLRGATHGKPGRVLTRWQKKPQIHRAAIRAAVFWGIVGATALTIYSEKIALLVLVFSSPLFLYMTYRKGRLVFFAPFTSTDAVNGRRAQHWVLKNSWRRLFRMQPVPGLMSRKERKMVDLPPEVAKALEASVNQDGGTMPNLKVTPYKRKGS